MSRAGRKRKAGERQPCGKLKPPERQGAAPTQIKRVMAEALLGAADWRLGTMLGWMLMTGQISSKRATAGWSYARLKGAYDFEMGFPCRTARSPAYGQGYRPVAEERLEKLDADMPAKIYETEQEKADRVDALKRRYNAARSAIEGRGLFVLGVVDRCCLDDMKPLYEEMRALVIGLDAYAEISSAKGREASKSPEIAA